MLDTIKLGIPLTQYQHSKLTKLLSNSEEWQWVKFKASTGELSLVRSKGLAQTDRHSFHRDIKFDVSSIYSTDNTFLTLEFSIPKFWYGHNIQLLYNYLPAIEHLRKLLQKQLHCRFPDVKEWQVWRVDICYGWRCPKQYIAQQVLNSLKGLHFPYKKPTIYPDSILFAGSTYSVKFYLKLPEFKQHDRKVLLKSNCKLEIINYLEELAAGVLRYEVTLRRRFLKKKGIKTLGDLLVDPINLDWSKEFWELNDHIQEGDVEAIYGCMFVICHYSLVQKGLSWENALKNAFDNDRYPLNDGDYYEAPFTVLELPNGKELIHKGGGFSVIKVSKPIRLLDYFLDRFLGENRTMDEHDEVKLKLKGCYKPVKAARLHAIWLYVQRYGSNEAKKEFGKDSFYRAKREIKAAGCSFVEPPRVTHVDEKFLKEFALQIPSPYVVNQIDAFRDGDNLINLMPYLEDKKAQDN